MGEVECSFLIPIVNDEIYLVNRGTEPYRGYWNAAGGKAERAQPGRVIEPVCYVEKPGGTLVPCIADTLRKLQGLETLAGTAIRESCEELLAHLKFPDDFTDSDITDIYKLGFLSDTVIINGQEVSAHNQFVLARINRQDFHFSTREIRDFRPLSGLPKESYIVPITLIALKGLRRSLTENWGVKSEFPYDINLLLRQLENPLITQTKIDRPRNTNMLGAILEYVDQGLL